MLRLFSGEFYPGLESAFLGRLKALKVDPLTPIAVIIPSIRLMEHLQKVMAESGQAVLNIQFHTLSSLAEEVVWDRQPLEKPALSDPLFFDTLVKSILRENRPFHRMADMAVPNGFPPAVRSTLRDLLEAGVDAANVEEAMDEEFVGREVDLGTLRELLTLYRLYLKRLEALPVYSRTVILKRAVDAASQSTYLAKFSELMFYGFYDFTGLQSELFQSIAKNHSTSLFFPYLRGHEAYAFSQRFRDTFLQPVEFEEIVVTETPHPQVDFEVASISGLHDEAWFVATEILKLHSEQNIPFEKIAVIARFKERVGPHMATTLMRWGIPVANPAPRSLVQFPWAQKFLEALKQEVWPLTGSWSDYVDRSLSVLAGFVDLEEDRRTTIRSSIEAFRRFSLVSPTVSKDEFIEDVADRFSRTDQGSEIESDRGVSLLHAEAARGLGFDAVILIGLEERVFPRVIREDPFLRDDARFALSDTLGYKITQKLTALQEEKLLFHLILSAARKKLVISYQRSDDEGKIVGPSSYLRSLVERSGKTLEDMTRSISRTYGEKLKSVIPSTASKREIVTRFLMAGQVDSAAKFVASTGGNDGWLKRGYALQNELNQFGVPGAYDGLLGPQSDERVFPHGYISPSALEVYGRCPFQYFTTRVLNLRPVEQSMSAEEMPADVHGKLVHTCMKNFFELWSAAGRPSEGFPSDIFEQAFISAFPELPLPEVTFHPLLWSIHRERVRIELKSYLEAELSDLAASGFVPQFFEQDISAKLPDLPEWTWFGKIDRIDVGPAGVRVVDYKTGSIARGEVAANALSGKKAQPPIYMLLADSFLRQQAQAPNEMSFAYHQIGRDEEKAELTSDDWKATRKAIVGTIKDQIGLIRSGNFLIVPDREHCRYCDVESICRRNHSLSAYRAMQGEGEKLMQIRTRKFKK